MIYIEAEKWQVKEKPREPEHDYPNVIEAQALLLKFKRYLKKTIKWGLSFLFNNFYTVFSTFLDEKVWLMEEKIHPTSGNLSNGIIWMAVNQSYGILVCWLEITLRLNIYTLNYTYPQLYIPSIKIIYREHKKKAIWWNIWYQLSSPWE